MRCAGVEVRRLERPVRSALPALPVWVRGGRGRATDSTGTKKADLYYNDHSMQSENRRKQIMQGTFYFSFGPQIKPAAAPPPRVWNRPAVTAEP
ncbi:MAG: hypothetical protein IJZ19_13770 [Lentisphaeria bacterium]|nr:hypothetical protein [Lentisphaeria bacterium]